MTLVPDAPSAAASLPAIDPNTPRCLRPLAGALLVVNRGLVVLGMLALLVAAVVLTSSVVTRYALHASTDWQDEAAVFCLVGATFLCSGYVQSLRGHVGIEALAGLLPAGVDRFRRVLVDLLSCAFCAFFAWKSWSLFHEAWAEGQTTSSSWAPPLWIPYLLMAAGMTLLALQAAVQLAASGRALVFGGRLRTEPTVPSARVGSVGAAAPEHRAGIRPVVESPVAESLVVESTVVESPR